MSKTAKTREIENCLHKNTASKNIYGCEEGTIGFHNNGHGNEIVDFCTMDSKGIIRCYEIKVTLPDLKSKAKKSWYGHYNYLVMPDELLNKVKDNIDQFIPDYVGVILPTSYRPYIRSYRNAKKQFLTPEVGNMMKESIIRSMYYKMTKYRMDPDAEELLNTKSELQKYVRKYVDEARENSNNKLIIQSTEKMLRRYYGIEVDLTDVLRLSYNDYPEKVELNKKPYPTAKTKDTSTTHD